MDPCFGYLYLLLQKCQVLDSGGDATEPAATGHIYPTYRLDVPNHATVVLKNSTDDSSDTESEGSSEVLLMLTEPNAWMMRMDMIGRTKVGK